jgi:ribosomal protein L13E
VTMVKKLLNKNPGHILVKRVTVKEPPAGALLASKKNKVKPVTKVQKVKKAPKQRSTHGVSMGESPSLALY